MAIFAEIADHVHDDTEILMALSDGCDMKMISWFVEADELALNCVYNKNILETGFIFKIKKS